MKFMDIFNAIYESGVLNRDIVEEITRKFFLDKFRDIISEIRDLKPSNYYTNPTVYIREKIDELYFLDDEQDRLELIVSIIRYTIYNKTEIIQYDGEMRYRNILSMISSFLHIRSERWNMARHYYIQVNFKDI